jgi:amidophosphoribosyltransferase
MPGQELRKKSVRQKLNAIDREFKGKNVLLVDDSIVRGTTSAQIVEMARESGAKNVYFASAAPEIRFPNVYGIDMPSAAELIAHGREVEDINQSISSDGLIFQSLSDLIAAVSQENPEITKFETSVFDGQYITGDIDQDYLNRIDKLRNDSAKSIRENAMSSGLEIHNQDENESD